MIETRGYAGERAAFLTLYRACLDHYDIPPATQAEEARILDLLARERHMSCLMAWDGAAAVGFATWGLTFPARTRTALYMKELFVSEAARGKGAGRALMTGLIDIAVAEGCVRIIWETSAGNDPAVRFYRSIDAGEYNKHAYRIDSADFAAMRARLGM